MMERRKHFEKIPAFIRMRKQVVVKLIASLMPGNQDYHYCSRNNYHFARCLAAQRKTLQNETIVPRQ